jgi:hypothetical protein
MSARISKRGVFFSNGKSLSIIIHCSKQVLDAVCWVAQVASGRHAGKIITEGTEFDHYDFDQPADERRLFEIIQEMVQFTLDHSQFNWWLDN